MVLSKMKMHKEDELLLGVLSCYKPGKHFLLLDYDELKPIDIVRDIRKLQFRYNLPIMFLLRTSRGHYSAVCFKGMSFRKMMTILLDSKCCHNFKLFTYKDKQSCLRVTKKPDKKSSDIKTVATVEAVQGLYDDMKLRRDFFRLLSMAGKEW